MRILLKSDGVASLIQTSVDSINIKYIARTRSNTKISDGTDIVPSDEISEFTIKFYGLGRKTGQNVHKIE